MVTDTVIEPNLYSPPSYIKIRERNVFKEMLYQNVLNSSASICIKNKSARTTHFLLSSHGDVTLCLRGSIDGGKCVENLDEILNNPNSRGVFK